jgi:hypothetical protein
VRGRFVSDLNSEDAGSAPSAGAVIRIFVSDTTDADFKEFVVFEVARV